MTFPSIHVYPRELPLWLLDGHEFAAGERIEATPYDQGEDRHREIRTFSPWMARVSTTLFQAQFDRLSEWFENDLQAGTQRFDTQVAGFNGALSQWWQAMFIGPFRYQQINGGLVIVTAELILLDGPYDAGFDPGSTGDTRVSPSLMGRAYSDSSATGALNSPGLSGWTDGDSEGQLVIDTSLYGRTDGNSEGQLIIDVGYLLLADGTSFLLQSDGVSRIILEN